MPYSATYYNLGVLPTRMLDVDRCPFKTALADGDFLGNISIL